VSQTEGFQPAWPNFLIALLLWGPDTPGQLLKAAGYTFRAAAAVPTALVHFMISVEGYPSLYEKVHTSAVRMWTPGMGLHMMGLGPLKKQQCQPEIGVQMQASYPAQITACVTAARDAVRLVLPPSAARAAQPFITARTLCYGVRAALLL